MVFHENLAGQHGVRSLGQIKSEGVLTQSAIVDEWDKILKVNYWSIFSIARELLLDCNPPYLAVQALEKMINTAESLVASASSSPTTWPGRCSSGSSRIASFWRPSTLGRRRRRCWPTSPSRTTAAGTTRSGSRNFHIADYACGTGTLIHAAYRRINQLHRLAGGDPERLHAAMMEHALTACDVLPSAVHLTASMLSSSYPQQGYNGSRTIVTEYGKTEHAKHGGVSLGSLDLLGSNGEVRPLIPLHSATAITGTGEVRAELGVDMPPCSQDLVIMNPPFTKPGSDWEGAGREADYIKQFRGLGTDLETQRSMAALEKQYGKGTCAHGYAGIASWLLPSPTAWCGKAAPSPSCCR